MNKVLKDGILDLEEILDVIGVGIYITDGNGKTLVLNNESEYVGGLTKKQVIGRTMQELVDEGYVKESGALKAIASGKKESFIQSLGNGDSVFITAIPHYTNNKIDYVVCTERDITESVTLEKSLARAKKMATQYKKEVEYMRRKNSIGDEGIVAENKDMIDLIEKTKRIANKDVGVLLMGESGTGKEEFAELIFKNSSRSNKPFIKVNCAAIPEGLVESEFFGYEGGTFTGADAKGKTGIFELANGGTIFLDELSEMPLHMQSKFLRVLQSKEIRRIGGKQPIDIDVRIIAATNVNLEEAIKKNAFREDLYYRINVMPITIPPLRERREDIKVLAEHFMEHFCQLHKVKKTIPKHTMTRLMEHSWPGNVRELKNIIERMVVSSDGLETSENIDVEKDSVNINSIINNYKTTNNSKSLTEIVEEYEKEILTQMMKKYQKASKVGQILSINKSTLSRKLNRYNINNLAEDEEG